MPKILCFRVKNSVYIGYVNSIDIFFSLFIMYFFFLLENSKLIQNYYNQKEKFLSKVFLGLSITIFIYSVISLLTLQKKNIQKHIIQFRFYISLIFFILSMIFFAQIFFIIQNCYQNLTNNKINDLENFINILFPKFNKENEEDLKNLRNIYIPFLVSIFMIFIIFVYGFFLKMLNFDKEEEDVEIVCSTWRTRSSLNKELNLTYF